MLVPHNGRPLSPEPLAEDLIDKVAVHDRTHFEVKLDYSVDARRKENRYRVTCWFFVPRTLGIDQETYPREHFYNDVAGYIRFKTPAVALDVLADPTDAASPLASIRRLVGQVKKTPSSRPLQETLVHEMRMFGCILRAQMRDQAKELRDRVRELARQPARRPILLQDLRTAWARFLDGAEAAIAAWRRLRPDFLSDPVPKWVRSSYGLVDEYASVVIEERLTALLGTVEDKMLGAPLAGEVERAAALLLSERQHREGAGYPSVLREDSDNEHYLYRLSQLKKFVMSVLWLEIAKEREGNRANELGAAIAAGTAMGLAVVLTIVQTRWWLINTWSFVVAAVLIYILKDRLKDWLRLFLRNRLSRFMADYSVAVTDPATGRTIGHCRETFTYAKERDVPAAVRGLRERGSNRDLTMTKPEVVLRYSKEVSLSGPAIFDRLRVEQRDIHDVNDIMRFGIASFLGRTDDPESGVATYDAESKSVKKRKLPRVYHMNVVLEIGAGDAARTPPVMQRLRVVFDKNGIRRLETDERSELRSSLPVR